MVGFSAFNLWSFYCDFGFTLVSLQRFEEAVPYLEFGLQRNAAVPHAQNALGYAFAYLNQLQQAQDSFARGLEYDPENALMFNNLAVVWMLAGVFQQAAQGLEQAVTLEGEHPAFVYNIMLLKQAAQTGVLEGTPRLELFFSRST